MAQKPKMPGRTAKRTGKVVTKRDGTKVKKASPNEHRSADIVMTEETIRDVEKLRELYKEDLELFAKDCLRVVDRDHPSGAAIIPLTFSASQKALDKLINDIGKFNLEMSEAKRAQGLDVPVSHLPIETVCLKARKVYASTYFRARAFWKNEFWPGHCDMVMAHDKDVARNLTEITRRFHKNWNETVPGLRTLLERNGDIIAWEHDSRTITKTAGSRSGGASQGYTYHFVQLSELSRYPDGSNEMASATTACATFREIHIESTARGDNELKTQWDNAMWLPEAIALFRAGKQFPRNWNGKYRFFWAWWQDPGYRIPLTEAEKQYVLDTLEDDEKAGIKNYGWTPEQIEWRRRKIANECSQQRDMPPKDFFRQEYPAHPDEAFVNRGTAVFPREPLIEMQAASKQLVSAIERGSTWQDMPHFCGDFTPMGSTFIQSPRRDIRGATAVLWTPPEPRKSYLLTIDTAEGKETGDDSVIGIYDRTNGLILREAARVIGKIRPDDLAKLAHYLHVMYNDAYTMSERNGPGIYTCMELVKLGCKNMYFQRAANQVGGGESDIPVPGFHTNTATKSLVVESMYAMLRDKHLWLRHPDAIRQALRYQVEDKKYAAPSGEHDDCVMADALACYAHQPDVAPPVWTGFSKEQREQLEKAVEEKPLSAEQEMQKHYRERIGIAFERARKKNQRELAAIARAERALGITKD